MKLSRFKAPNTFFIIFSLIIVMAALTWVIPGGEYARVEVEGRQLVDPNSFEYVKSNPQGIGAVLMAPIRGFVEAALIIGFVLIVGGAFGIFQKTKAIDAAIKGLAKAQQSSRLIEILTIPLFMLLFSLGGAVFGMSEETIPFVLIFVPLALTLGYDSIVGVAIPFIGAGAGFAGAFLNPFTIGIAQGIAEVPLFSGLQYRFVAWVIITGIAIAFVMIYAARIKKDPEKSVMYEKDEKKRADLDTDEIENFGGLSRRHKGVLWTFAAGMGVLIFGVLTYHWYIEEIAAVFLATGIAVGIVGKLGINDVADAFEDGAKTLVGTAIIIGLARGILVVAQGGHIIDTMLHSLSVIVSDFHPIVASQMMFIVQTFLNFFVPSGSGQAALTMPIMAPLADLVGVTRQTAVLAFQFGDGFSNLIIPTSAVTMGVLMLADIPWEKWAKWILPLEFLFLIAGLLLLVPPFLMGW
ncbi:MAG: TIGR00366 family protein [Candidatus Marinimicrobia bacterium]|nr:TIGR00366 family protein [Candidatus Neomarinimicrobiota bacterium]MCF7828581.1 TIGR00366 family protein [Candidatus Neomarinimicrobiota bacterium]MCF7880322.1 TIGR00366 family protein [Candidatus Neomarinimicrobiota bacterium]